MSDLLDENPKKENEIRKVKRKIRVKKVVGVGVIMGVIVFGLNCGVEYVKDKNSKTSPNQDINALLQVEQEEDRARVERVLNSKVAYLTFDDGPNYNTNKILDVLKANDIKATFFLVGAMVENNPSIVARIKDEGHTIANHTYSHNYSYKTKEDFIIEIESTDKLISESLGEDFKSYFVRVPGGSMGKPSVQEAIKENGYKSINWTAKFGDDEKGGKVDKDYIINRVNETTGDDKYEVILAHSNKFITADVLQIIIDNLKKDGYIFEPLMEDSPVYFN